METDFGVPEAHSSFFRLSALRGASGALNSGPGWQNEPRFFADYCSDKGMCGSKPSSFVAELFHERSPCFYKATRRQSIFEYNKNFLQEVISRASCCTFSRSFDATMLPMRVRASCFISASAEPMDCNSAVVSMGAPSMSLGDTHD